MTSTGTRLAGAAAAAALALTDLRHARAGRLDQQEIRIETRSTPESLGVAGPSGDLGAGPMAHGSGLIVGQAVEAYSTRPIGGALVTLGFAGARPIQVLADGEGRFVFRTLPKGRFNIAAPTPVYVDGASRPLRPSGHYPSLELAMRPRLEREDPL